MTAQPNTQKPFLKILHNGEKNEQTMDPNKLQERSQALAAEKERIAQEEAELLQAQAAAEAAERAEKLEKRSALLDDAADWREMARTNPSPEKAKDYLRRAKEAESEATQLAVELNLAEPAATPSQVKQIETSTTTAIVTILLFFVAFVGATWYFGKPLVADPMNAIGQSMMQNAPIRALMALTLTFLTFLVGVFFIWLAFPPFFKIWHNRINSERTLESLLSEAPAWAVLLSFLGLLYSLMQVFASYYQALYA